MGARNSHKGRTEPTGSRQAKADIPVGAVAGAGGLDVGSLTACLPAAGEHDRAIGVPAGWPRWPVFRMDIEDSRPRHGPLRSARLPANSGLFWGVWAYTPIQMAGPGYSIEVEALLSSGLGASM
jgi:hypothetical protein